MQAPRPLLHGLLLLLGLTLTGGTGCGPDLEARVPEPLASKSLERPRPPGPPRRFACVDRNVSRSARQVVPLLEFLERRSQFPVDLAYFVDHETQLEALLAGRVEFAWLSPTAYVLARQRLPVVPLVRPVMASRTTYRSLLLVREDDRAQSLQDLKGRDILMVRPDSTSGGIFPRSFLEQQGIDPERFFGSVEYSGSHYKSYFSLARGEADAVFVEDSLLASASAEMKVRFRILETVAEIPHGPIVAHPEVTPEDLAEVRKAFAAYETDPLNHSLVVGLMQATGIQAFRPAADQDYQDVRRHLVDREEAP